MTEGYCMKCKEKREIKDGEEVKMKNGRPAMKGVCSTCGTKMFKILSTKKQVFMFLVKKDRVEDLLQRGSVCMQDRKRGLFPR